MLTLTTIMLCWSSSWTRRRSIILLLFLFSHPLVYHSPYMRAPGICSYATTAPRREHSQQFNSSATSLQSASAPPPRHLPPTAIMHHHAVGFWDNDIWKAWCLQAEFCVPTVACKSAKRMGKSEWVVCMDELLRIKQESSACLVYSVGIAQDWAFDAAMGELGCEVHAFDPTVNHPSNLTANVTFHNIGLYGGEKNSTATSFKSAGNYGAIKGLMYTFDEVVDMLGHRGRVISVLKIDCEGCEWEIFGGPNVNRSTFSKVSQLLVELHFSKRLQVGTVEKVKYIGRTFDNLFSIDLSAEETKDGYNISFYTRPFSRFSFNYNHGIRRDRALIKEFYDAGFPNWACCRNVGFIRLA